MNFIHIAGHLGADPEVRFTSSGVKVTTFRVATKTRKAGKEDTIWWRVTVWGEQFDKMVPYLKKGSPIIAHGELQKPEIFQDREGKPQIALGMTASYLEFSPFGRTEKTTNTTGFTNYSQKEPSQGNHGQEQNSSQDEPSFPEMDEEEVPF